MTPIIAPGDGEYSADLGGTSLKVFTYRPQGAPRLALAVFHGLHRDAGPYRDRARPLADKIGAVVVSPEFDAERFSTELYQRGGIAQDGKFPGQAHRRSHQAAAGVERRRVRRQRSCHGVARSLRRRPVPEPRRRLRRNRRDQAGARQPVDLGVAQPAGCRSLAPISRCRSQCSSARRTPAPTTSPPNPRRWHRASTERSRSTFAKAKAAAAESGWPFGWRIAEVPGVGHDSARMFDSAQAAVVFA